MQQPMFRSPVLAIVLANVLAASLAAGCGSSSSDDAAKFAGDWSFNPGMAMCTAPAITISLTGLAVTITKVSSTSIIIAAGASCSITFKVSGNTATADPGQSCTLDNAAGPQTIMVSSWTLTIAGDAITNTASGMASLCAVNVTGTLTKGTVDAGAGETGG